MWRHALLNRLAAALVALALAVLGLAHAPVARAQQDAQLEAWIAEGGSAIDLCGTGSGAPDHRTHADCPACALAKSFALPDPAPAPVPGLRYMARCPVQRAAHLADGHTPRAPPARGPPSPLA